MHSNTLKTIIGFCRAALERHTPLTAKGNDLKGIYNYLPIEGLYATSGQPSEEQFTAICDAGYTTVINLAPTSILENSIVNERAILAELGLEYIHQSVDFKNPKDKDFTRFVEALKDKDLSKVWVHCAANMRVSAFTYRYRRTVLNIDESTARADLQKIWEPIGVWKKFIRKT